MGHSREDKAESHERIVRAASARFREAGVEGIGLAQLMKEVGLTHGGFYRHFDSREDLVAEAVERALLDGGQRAASVLSLNLPSPLGALVDGYLSLVHRDQRESSCAVTTLAADVARSNDRTRSAYTRQVGVYLDLIAQWIPGEDEAGKRKRAIAAMSTMVGALSMARAVNDEKLSRELLKSAASELKAQLGVK